MAKLRSTITGDREIDSLLAELPKTLANGVLRKASRDVCKSIVLPDVRRRAPVKTGKLAKSFSVRVAKGRRGKRLPRGVIGHQVVADSRKHYGAFTALFLELGTKSRATRRRSTTLALESDSSSSATSIRAAMNRGKIKARRFMRDALFQNANDIQMWFVGKVRIELPAAIAKAKAKKSSGPVGPDQLVIGADARDYRVNDGAGEYSL